MMQAPVRDRPTHPPILESAEIVIALLIMGFGWFIWYLARERYYLSSMQVAELATYFAIALTAVLGTSLLIITRRSRREREWPHPPMAISRRRDERIPRDGWAQDSVILGYDIHGQPWYWPDQVRVMQGITLGMTGSGKCWR